MCIKCLTLGRETKDPGGAVVLDKLVVKKDTKEIQHREHYKMLNHIVLMTAVIRASKNRVRGAIKNSLNQDPRPSS